MIGLLLVLFPQISIHSLRMEGDSEQLRVAAAIVHFNPLPPHGGRQIHHHDQNRNNKFQSTPSAWRETLTVSARCNRKKFQSTPSAWRETWLLVFLYILIHHFNPLPPHGGRQRSQLNNAAGRNFNPLPPHGGRPKKGGTVIGWIDISIHSLRMEGDEKTAPTVPRA